MLATLFYFKYSTCIEKKPKCYQTCPIKLCMQNTVIIWTWLLHCTLYTVVIWTCSYMMFTSFTNKEVNLRTDEIFMKIRKETGSNRYVEYIIFLVELITSVNKQNSCFNSSWMYIVWFKFMHAYGRNLFRTNKGGITTHF